MIETELLATTPDSERAVFIRQMNGVNNSIRSERGDKRRCSHCQRSVYETSAMGFYHRWFESSVRDLKSAAFYRALLGEMLGVMLLVFVACSSVYGQKAPVDIVRISLGFGLSVGTLVWILANVSGGHINPAVTAGMFVTRKISGLRCLMYVVCQCTGGAIGAAIMQAVSCPWQEDLIKKWDSRNDSCGLGLTDLSPGVSPGQGFAIELIITFVLVITVFATCDSSRCDLRGSGPLAIGLSVTMCHLGFVPLTGASMNSARTFGPALVLGAWNNHWVYWAGPVLGGVLAGLLYEFVFAGNAGSVKLASWIKDAHYERAVDPEKAKNYELKANGLHMEGPQPSYD